MAHANARLTVRGRQLIIERINSGMRQAHVAEMQGVSRATVSKWWRRYRQEGLSGLEDRSSRPRLSPLATAAEKVAGVLRLRRELGVGPHQIAARLSMAVSTVYRTLRRHSLSRLAWLDRTTRTIIRYEKQAPGDLMHADTKKLRRIPDGGGRRKDPGWHETNTSYRIRGPLRGLDFVHVAVDDCSRYAYVEVLQDEKAVTTEGFLRRAAAAFKEAGVTVMHIITDNGSNYRSKLFRKSAEEMGICLHNTRPYRPQTNGKAEAFIKTLKREWAYAKIYTSNAERTEALAGFIDYYNHRRPHTSLGLKPPASRL